MLELKKLLKAFENCVQNSCDRKNETYANTILQRFAVKSRCRRTKNRRHRVSHESKMQQPHKNGDTAKILGQKSKNVAILLKKESLMPH